MHSRFESSKTKQSEMPARVEQYLADLTAPVPGAQQEEWRTEAQQHLNALIAAHEELGLSPEEATEAALRSFGEARQIGTRVAYQVRQESRKALTQAVAHAVMSYAKPILPCLLLSLALILGYAYGSGGGDAYLNALSALSFVLLVVCPVMGGWSVGRRAEGQTAARAIGVVPLLATVLCLPDVLLFSLMRNHLLMPPVGQLFFGASLWLLLSVGAAGLAWQQRPRPNQVLVSS